MLIRKVPILKSLCEICWMTTTSWLVFHPDNKQKPRKWTFPFYLGGERRYLRILCQMELEGKRITHECITYVFRTTIETGGNEPKTIQTKNNAKAYSVKT